MKSIPLHGLLRKLLQTENQVVGLGLHQSSENVISVSADFLQENQTILLLYRW
jgi:hypothetical protein